MLAFLAQVGPLPAPVIEEGALSVAGLGLLLSLVVAMGLRLGWDHTLGALLRGLADLFRAKAGVHIPKVGTIGIGIPGGGAVASAVDKAEHAVQHAIGIWIDANQAALGKWWAAQKWVAQTTYDSLVWFAAQTYDAMYNLTTATVPHLVGGALHPIRVDLGKLRGYLEAETQQLWRGLVHKAQALEAELARDFGRAWKGIDHINTKGLPRLAAWIGAVAGGLAALKHYAHNVLGRRLTNVEKRTGAAAIGAIALATLTRVFPYWKCSNVRRFNKGLCRSPLGSLDWLFALAGAAVVALDIEQIYHAAEDLTDELGGLFERIER